MKVKQTFTIEEKTLKEIKFLAVKNGRSYSVEIEQAITEYLAKQ